LVSTIYETHNTFIADFNLFFKKNFLAPLTAAMLDHFHGT